MLLFGSVIAGAIYLLPILVFVSFFALTSVVGMPSVRTELGRVKLEKTMRDIPQWHCLRLFKHDVHLQRRCRNHRVPMFRRLSE